MTVTASFVPAFVSARFPRQMYLLRINGQIFEALDLDGKPLRDGKAPFPIWKAAA